MTRRNSLIGAVVVFLALVMFLGARAANAGPGAHTVTLRATGGTAMDVTYGVGDKNSQNTAAPSPWQTGYQVTGDLPLVTMVVQNGGGGSATVSCSITEDGAVVDSNTSHGAYAVVQCTA